MQNGDTVDTQFVVTFDTSAINRSSCRERASKLFSRHEIAELTWLPDLSFKDRSTGTAGREHFIEL